MIIFCNAAVNENCWVPIIIISDIWDYPAVAIVMGGKTTAKYLCPCSDEETGFQGQSFWVELTGPGSWPSLLSGRCLRCGDNWVGRHLHSPNRVSSYFACGGRGVCTRIWLQTSPFRFYTTDKSATEPCVAKKVCIPSNYDYQCCR